MLWVLVATGAALGLTTGGFFLYGALTDGEPPFEVLIIALLTATSAAGLLAVWGYLVHARGLSWQQLGLCRPQRSIGHLTWQIPAMLLAAAIVSGLLLTALGLEEADPDAGADALFTGGPLLALVGLALVAVLVPIFEELVFRGILYPALRARLRAAVAIAVCALLFAAVHFVPAALGFLLVTGIALTWLAEWYRSIVPSIIAHGVNNALVSAGTLLVAGMG